jgi:hypothetical protein
LADVLSELQFNVIKCPKSIFKPGFDLHNNGNGKLFTTNHQIAELIKSSPHFHGEIEILESPPALDFIRDSFVIRKWPESQLKITEEPSDYLSFLPLPSLRQTTNTIMMVAPIGFTTNEETLVDNYFMKRSTKTPSEVERAALLEFSQLHLNLINAGIRVVLFSAENFHNTPDAVFPNNWFSTHTEEEAGRSTVVFYPMKTPSRRQERRQWIISQLVNRYDREFSLTHWEVCDFPRYLESTGVLVMDRVKKVAYAALSQRCSKQTAKIWAKKLNYRLCTFRATDAHVS